MSHKVIGLSVALTLATLMVGCANVTTGQLHAPLEVMPTEVCIIRNPQVTIDAAIPSLQSAFQRRGIKSTVVDDVGEQSSASRHPWPILLRRFWEMLPPKLAYPSRFCGTSAESRQFRNVAADLRRRQKAYERGLSGCG